MTTPMYNPLLMATPVGGPSFDRAAIVFNARTVVQTSVINQPWRATNGIGALQMSVGRVIIDYDDSTNPPSVVWGSKGILRKVRAHIQANSYNKRFEVYLLKNGEKYGQLQFAVQAGVTGDFANPVVGSQFLVMNWGDEYVWGFFTDDELVPTGKISMVISTEIYFGAGLS